ADRYQWARLYFVVRLLLVSIALGVQFLLFVSQRWCLEAQQHWHHFRIAGRVRLQNIYLLPLDGYLRIVCHQSNEVRDKANSSYNIQSVAEGRRAPLLSPRRK